MTTVSRRQLPVSDSAAIAVRRALVEDFEVLEANADRLERKNEELASLNERLIQENGVIREELDKRTREVQKLQAYSVRITTQLDIIMDVISSAKQDAMVHAAGAGRVPEKAQEKPTPVAVVVKDDALHDGFRAQDRLPRAAIG